MGTSGGSISTGGNGNTGGHIAGSTGGDDTMGGNTGGSNDHGGATGNAGTDGNAGSGNAGSGNAGSGGGAGAGGTNENGGASVADSGVIDSGAAFDASTGGGAGTSSGSDAAVKDASPAETVSCPNPSVITNNAIEPLLPIKLPLCVLPEKCCYGGAGTGGSCVDHGVLCTDDTFQCDGPEDCADGSICCGYTTGVLTTQIAIGPGPVVSTTNTACTSALKCGQLAGRATCHTVGDCAAGVVGCAAGGGLPSPYKVCGPILLPPVSQ